MNRISMGSLLALVSFGLSVFASAATFAQDTMAAQASIDVTLETLIKFSKSENAQLRQEAFNGLVTIHTLDEQLIERVQQGLQSEDMEIRGNCANILNSQPWPPEIKGRLLFSMLTSSNEEASLEAAQLIGPDHTRENWSALIKLLQDNEIPIERRKNYLHVVVTHATDQNDLLDTIATLYTKEDDQEYKSILLRSIGMLNTQKLDAMQFLSEETSNQTIEIQLAAIQSINQLLDNRETRFEISKLTLNKHIEPRADKFIQQFDLNGDKLIDDKELLQAKTNLDIRDRNRDQFYDRAEIMDGIVQSWRSGRNSRSRNHRGIGQITQTVDAYMQRYDSNRDGSLDATESDRLTRSFPNIDRDHDGNVTTSELRRALLERTGRGATQTSSRLRQSDR